MRNTAEEIEGEAEVFDFMFPKARLKGRRDVVSLARKSGVGGFRGAAYA